MALQEFFACLVAICVISVIDGAAIHKANAAILRGRSRRDVPYPGLTAIQNGAAQPQGTQQQQRNKEDDLEHDLDSVRLAGNEEVNKEMLPEEGQDQNQKNNEDDEIDIQLLYDLIRAVEYEANAELFNSILQEQGPYPDNDNNDNNNQRGTGQPVAATDGDIEGSSADDANGKVTAQQVPVNRHAPLHKRLANVLKDVPGALAYPSGSSATKRNMLKKAAA